MDFYVKTLLRQDFITKFSYKNLAQLPKLEKITLTFSITQSSLKSILPLISSLTLLSSQKPSIYPLKKSKLLLELELRQGVPVGCKVDLRGQLMYFFLSKFVFSLCLKLKEFNGFSLTDKNLFFRIKNLFLFEEIENEYEYFSDLPSLNMNLSFQVSNELELLNFLSGLNLPIKNF